MIYNIYINIYIYILLYIYIIILYILCKNANIQQSLCNKLANCNTWAKFSDKSSHVTLKNHGKPLSKGQRCSGLQQHRANVLMSTVSCVHQGSTAWRTETNETNETGQSSKMFKVYPFDELVGTAYPTKKLSLCCVGPMWAFIVCERRIRSNLQKSLRGKEDRCERSAKTLQVRCKDGIKVSRVRGRHSQSTSDRKGVRRCQKYEKQWEFAHTIWLCNSLPWKITMLLIGKPSISMGHLYHGYVC